MMSKNYAKRVAKDFNIGTRLYQHYAMALFHAFALLFYKLKYHHGSKEKHGGCIYAANHISYCDPFMVTWIARHALGYMAKKELFEESKWVGKNIWRLGAFSVNREKPEVSTLKSSKEAFKAGFGLCIFPQGGIRKNKKIEDVTKGFAVVAKMVKADIVPVSITGLEVYNWNPFKKVPVDVKIGEKISYTLPDEEIVRLWRTQVAQMAGYELCEASANTEEMLASKS
jgi:1-acyl-sn-glycerol-3-phosphate acyltransferase